MYNEYTDAMKNSTLLFLIRKSGGATDVCLAMRKDGRKGRYNGIDSVVAEGESIEAAVSRSAVASVGVMVNTVVKHAEITFIFPHDQSSDQVVHIFTTEDFEGEPASSETMEPSWLSTSYIPYSEMWQDAIFWLPHVLDGENIRGRFVLDEGDVIQEKEVTIVETL